ncbi:hypothetical protein [Nocardiopsis sp. RV163]|uniref:hypothetical protein n=1 Tax=Nocardiopsis sp. RV163 TaxID=1661388 RepID=UPI00064C4176|nr:hypothetical protein [Nocardiopsis sp. RV163]
MSFFDDVFVLPYPHRLRASRTRRRCYAVLHVLITLAVAVLTWAATQPDPGPVRSFLQAIGMVGLLGAWFAVHARLGQATDLMVGYRRLDERQRTELDRATRIGHNATSVFILVVFLAGVIGGFLPASLTSELALPVLWMIYMVHASTPLLLLAWTRPNEVPDDEDA